MISQLGDRWLNRFGIVRMVGIIRSQHVLAFTGATNLCAVGFRWDHDAEPVASFSSAFDVVEIHNYTFSTISDALACPSVEPLMVRAVPDVW